MVKNDYPQAPLDKIVYNRGKFVDNFRKAYFLRLVRLLKVVEEKKNKG